MLLTEDDKKAIAETIHKAEATTSGEIVFAVSDASGRYLQANFQGALIGMAAATAVYLLMPAAHSIGMLLWIEILSFALFYALLPHLPWRRWLVTAQEMETRVHEAAFVEFFSSGLHRTREANGVLIYLSAFERRVVVLGDRGIHEKMGDRHWDEARDTIIRSIREGKARQGICAAVELCGRGLAEYFPPRPDDVNELPDQVIDRRREREAP